MTPFTIRTATKADAPAISALVNHYITNSTSIFIIEPEALEERLVWFEQRDEAHPAVVAEVEGGRFVGWGALSVHNPRAGYRHTADVSVYIEPDFHRRGIGRGILGELVTRARAAGHHALLALCCSESIPSIRLHESLGFRRVGELREVGRKFDRWLDVVYLELLL